MIEEDIEFLLKKTENGKYRFSISRHYIIEMKILFDKFLRETRWLFQHVLYFYPKDFYKMLMRFFFTSISHFGLHQARKQAVKRGSGTAIGGTSGWKTYAKYARKAESLY